MMMHLGGQPGTGKSTLATGIALDYMREHRRVVSNFPIDAAPATYSASDKLSQAFCEVIPARPSVELIYSLGLGWVQESDYQREDRAGLLIIDEAQGWIPSREWRAPGREALIDWCSQHRKLGWDVLLISPHVEQLDNQIRTSCIEVTGRAKRSDRKKFIGFKLPRFHFVIFRYGLNEKGQMLDRKVYRGALEHQCFNSYSTFNTGVELHYCTLPARITRWRKIDWRKENAKAKHPLVVILMKMPEEQRLKHWKRFDSIGAFDTPPERWRSVFAPPVFQQFQAKTENLALA
jgi:hypothetical protein